MEEQLLKIETAEKDLEIVAIDDGDFRLWLIVNTKPGSVEINISRDEARQIIEALETFLRMT